MVKKSLIVISLLFGMSFYVLAEGSKEPSVVAEESKDTVVVWAPISDPSEQASLKNLFIKMATDFEEEHPAVHVDVQFPADWGRKIMVVLAAGNPPDISFTAYSNQYTDVECAIPIDDDVTPEDRKEIPKAKLDECRATTGPNIGKLIAWPISIGGPAGLLSVNTDLFEEAGVLRNTLFQIQEEGWTADDFLTVMRKLTSLEGIMPYIPLVSGGMWSMAWALQFNCGGAFDSAVNPETPGDFQKERWFGYQGPPYENFLNFLTSLCQEKIIPPEAATMPREAIETLFFSGKVAMVDGGGGWGDRVRKWNEEITSGTREGKPMDMLDLPLPRPDEHTTERTGGGQTSKCIIVYKQTEYQGDAHTLNARKVARYFAHHRDIGAVAAEYGELPVSNSAVKSLSGGKYSYLATDPNIKFQQNYVNRIEYGNIFVTAWAEWININQECPPLLRNGGVYGVGTL